jgi:peptidoglycan/xylan/chitin deacetylase (PgdA/CDA1 family)
MNTSKPLASLSLDLDNEWSYLKTHGDPGWKSLPSYLDVLVPRVLAFLQARRLSITVFVVGQDAARPANRDMLRALATAGHEIGNHSFHHDPWMERYPAAEVEREILLAEEHIERATGQAPVGYRGPGFSLPAAGLRVLARCGYLYDASTFPTFLMPLARAYYFLTARFSPEEKQLRQHLGGTLAAGWRPLKPYRWHIDGRTLLEIPVTTMPLVKIPIHASYLMCLAAISPRLAVRYFEAALLLCRCTQTPPSLLLHPTDWLGRDDRHRLSFFPGMSLTWDQKQEVLNEVLGRLAATYQVVPLRDQAQVLARQRDLPQQTAPLAA